MHQRIGKYIIRNWRADDAPSIARYADNKKIWANLRDLFPHPYTLKDAETFLSLVMQAGPPTAFAIATSTEAIGGIGLTPGKDVHRFTAEMGYWLAEPFWGKGIMTRAVKFMAAYAINDLKLHRVFAQPYTINPASARVLEKAGFTREGRLRSSVFKDGRVLDQFMYSLIGVKSAQADP